MSEEYDPDWDVDVEDALSPLAYVDLIAGGVAIALLGSMTWLLSLCSP